MATLDSDQLTDFYADIGTDYGTVFSVAEAHRLYTRADSDYNKTIVLAFRQIMSQAAKLNDYRLAQSMENKSQVFDHLRELLTYWEGVAANTQQIRIIGLRNVPPRDKDTPDSDT